MSFPHKTSPGILWRLASRLLDARGWPLSVPERGPRYHQPPFKALFRPPGASFEFAYKTSPSTSARALARPGASRTLALVFLFFSLVLLLKPPFQAYTVALKKGARVARLLAGFKASIAGFNRLDGVGLKKSNTREGGRSRLIGYLSKRRHRSKRLAYFHQLVRGPLSRIFGVPRKPYKAAQKGKGASSLALNYFCYSIHFPHCQILVTHQTLEG